MGAGPWPPLLGVTAVTRKPPSVFTTSEEHPDPQSMDGGASAIPNPATVPGGGFVPTSGHRVLGAPWDAIAKAMGMSSSIIWYPGLARDEPCTCVPVPGFRGTGPRPRQGLAPSAFIKLPLEPRQCWELAGTYVAGCSVGGRRCRGALRQCHHPTAHLNVPGLGMGAAWGAQAAPCDRVTAGMDTHSQELPCPFGATRGGAACREVGGGIPVVGWHRQTQRRGLAVRGEGCEGREGAGRDVAMLVMRGSRSLAGAGFGASRRRGGRAAALMGTAMLVARRRTPWP